MLPKNYDELAQKFNEFLNDAKEYKYAWEIKSFVNESFYEGNHRVVYDTEKQSLTTLPLTNDNFIEIEKIRKMIRGIRNMILKNDPRWHPHSSRKKVVSEKEKQVASSLLQSIYKEEHIKDKLKDLLTHSLVKTIAWAYVGYDNYKKDIDIFIEDPFNIYTSPDGRLEGPVFVGKYIIRTVRKSLSDIKNSSLYNKGKFKEVVKQLQPDTKMAESDLKNEILAKDYVVPTSENGSVILQELYIMEDDKGNHKSSEEDQVYHNNNYKVRIISKVGDHIIRDEKTDLDQFPFIAYQPERNKGLLYQNSRIAPLVKLNRVLDEGYSNRNEWVEKFAKGRYIVEKGTKFTVVKGRNGQVIEYVGTKPIMEDVKPLPAEADVHLQDTERLMEDIGGLHSESMGRTGRTLSGVAIAQLQAADNNNISEPVDNLKTFMEELAYRILYLASKYYNLRPLTLSSLQKVNVIGEDVRKEIETITGQQLDDLIIDIKPIKSIEVEIVPGSAFSDLQARQDLVELKSLGVPIPDKLIIDTYKLGNTGEIIREYYAEQEEKEERESGIEGLEAQQAELENKKLLNGIDVVAQEGENHEIHLAIHSAELQKNKDAKLLIKHMQEHEMFLNGGQQQTNQEQQIQADEAMLNSMQNGMKQGMMGNIGQAM